MPQLLAKVTQSTCDSEGSRLTRQFQASVSTSSPAGVDTSAFQSSEDDSIFEKPRAVQETTSVALRSSDHASTQKTPDARTHAATDGSTQPEVIGKLLESQAVNELDYEVFVLEKTNFASQNKAILPKDTTAKASFLYPSNVVREVTEGPILAATGTTGVVQVSSYTRISYPS